MEREDKMESNNSEITSSGTIAPESNNDEPDRGSVRGTMQPQGNR
jgi:hypothetical protein